MIQWQGQDEQNAQNIQDQDGQQNEHQDQQEEHAGLYQQNHTYGYSHQGYYHYQPQLYTGNQDHQQEQYNQNSIGLNQGQYQHDGKPSQEKIKHNEEEMILLTDLDQKFTSLAISNKDNKIRNANEQI